MVALYALAESAFVGIDGGTTIQFEENDKITMNSTINKIVSALRADMVLTNIGFMDN